MTIGMRMDFFDFGIVPELDVPEPSEVFDATALAQDKLGPLKRRVAQLQRNRVEGDPRYRVRRGGCPGGSECTDLSIRFDK